MLDSTGSLTQITLRPLSHVRVNDTNEVQAKFYKFESLLGRGTFGTVMKATEYKTGLKWAIKIINKAQSGASRIKLFEREISILRAVYHPHIIHLERVLESPHTLFLVFELCLEELRELYQKKKRFTEDEARYIIASLASAVTYLHSHDIVHRDLKLENILVTNNPADPDDKLFIKVTDFGLSVVRGGVGHESMLQELCGTPAYMSPELYSQRMYSQQCDVWAMGVIMYMLLTGSYPFEANSGKSLAQVVQSQEPNYNCSPFKNSPGPDGSPARKLLKKMLEKNPAYRATASEVERDPWTRGTKDGEPATKNAMELMRLWRQDASMRQPPSETDKASKAVARRLSYLYDPVRPHPTINLLRSPPLYATGKPRAADERARNMAIRKTFGELSPSGSVTVIPARNRRASRSSGDSLQQQQQQAEAGRRVSRVADTRRMSRVVPDARRPSRVVADGRRPSRVADGRRASQPAATTLADGRRASQPAAMTLASGLLPTPAPSLPFGGQESPGAARRRSRPSKLSIIEEKKEVTPFKVTVRTMPTGTFGVVGRERKQGPSSVDTISTANLMPEDTAPPIVYYDRKSAPQQRDSRYGVKSNPSKKNYPREEEVALKPLSKYWPEPHSGTRPPPLPPIAMLPHPYGPRMEPRDRELPRPRT